MEYEGVICRPPMELGAFLLPVAVGCTHNQCTFCAFYKDKTFRNLQVGIEKKFIFFHSVTSSGSLRIRRTTLSVKVSLLVWLKWT